MIHNLDPICYYSNRNYLTQWFYDDVMVIVDNESLPLFCKTVSTVDGDAVRASSMPMPQQQGDSGARTWQTSSRP